jgi:hypothetical protein
MVVINQCQSIQNSSNFWFESADSTWNDLTGIKLMLEDSHVDESIVLLICLFFVWPASHFTLFNNQALIPVKEHPVLNGLALFKYKGTT